ncbi:hypothetical protein LWI28_017463 [Acer negundo]|uniref:Uncharacterized protein n=1 Tax=Acer negundo TaxID=4023 RepID=A0AAD5NL20_ACENE|nr:hypothetical protein LWI28_017463 [Acer negundo]
MVVKQKLVQIEKRKRASKPKISTSVDFKSIEQEDVPVGLASDNESIANEDDTSLPIGRMDLDADEILRRQANLERLVREMTEGLARDFSDMRKELKLTPYTRRNRNTVDPVTSSLPSLVVDAIVDEKAAQIEIALARSS